jgi:6-phosphogluconate dehydrogenase
MQLGMVGLGRMGANIVRRLMRAGIGCAVYDRDPAPGQALAKEGATPAASLKALVEALEAPRTIWIMLPAGPVTEGTIAELSGLLSPGDTIVDGGNSFWKDDIRRARELSARGLHYCDVGTSGGVWGLERGYCLMIGGEAEVVRRLDPVWKALAPGKGSIPATSGREGHDPRAEEGYIHAGRAGAGHFVKMVHNGIEYGMMQAFAEGFDIMRHANADTLPEEERLDLQLPDIAEVWRRGSVVSSWLLDLTAALYTRFRSREDESFAEKLLSAMRKGFGGHVEKAGK